MTSETKSWEEMEPRERDAWVAENVMGWTRPRVANIDDEFRVIQDEIPPFPVDELDYSNPPKIVEDWRSDWHWRMPHGACQSQPSYFTTSPYYDYDVLVKVRETWDGDQQWVFSRYLERLWFPRRSSSVKNAFGIQYEPGDYSHTAFLALNDADV